MPWRLCSNEFYPDEGVCLYSGTIESPLYDAFRKYCLESRTAVAISTYKWQSQDKMTKIPTIIARPFFGFTIILINLILLWFELAPFLENDNWHKLHMNRVLGPRFLHFYRLPYSGTIESPLYDAFRKYCLESRTYRFVTETNKAI